MEIIGESNTAESHSRIYVRDRSIRARLVGDLRSENMMATPNNVCRQALQLDASGSVDEDNLADDPFEFDWYCENRSGGACLSPSGGALLDLVPRANEAALYVPAGSFPIGKLLENPAKPPGPVQSSPLSSRRGYQAGSVLRRTMTWKIFPATTYGVENVVVGAFASPTWHMH